MNIWKLNEFIIKTYFYHLFIKLFLFFILNITSIFFLLKFLSKNKLYSESFIKINSFLEIIKLELFS